MIIHGLAPVAWEQVALGRGYDVSNGTGLKAWKRDSCGGRALMGELFPRNVHKDSWLDTGGAEPSAEDVKRSVDEGYER
jgi:hypothetical protein